MNYLLKIKYEKIVTINFNCKLLTFRIDDVSISDQITLNFLVLNFWTSYI